MHDGAFAAVHERNSEYCGKGVRQTYDAFRAAGMRDCTLKLYPGLRHEILNEKAYTADITKNIEAWLLSRLEK